MNVFFYNIILNILYIYIYVYIKEQFLYTIFSWYTIELFIFFLFLLQSCSKYSSGHYNMVLFSMFGFEVVGSLLYSYELNFQKHYSTFFFYRIVLSTSLVIIASLFFQCLVLEEREPSILSYIKEQVYVL